MGGHGHGHDLGYKIPSPDQYKVEDVPKLKEVQEKLAKKGLKDPWLRNEVWRYTAAPGTPLSRALTGLLRGTKLGVPLFLLTLAWEYSVGTKDDGHGHHGENHGGHH